MLEVACANFSPHLPDPIELPQFRIISGLQDLSDLSSTVSDPFMDGNSDILASSEEQSDEEDSDSDVQSDDDGAEGIAGGSSTVVPDAIDSSTSQVYVETYLQTSQETDDEQGACECMSLSFVLIWYWEVNVFLYVFPGDGFDIHQKFELYRSERFHREEFIQAQVILKVPIIVPTTFMYFFLTSKNSALCNEPDLSESLPLRIKDTTGWIPQQNTQEKVCSTSVAGRHSYAAILQVQTSVFYKNPDIAKKLLDGPRVHPADAGLHMCSAYNPRPVT